MDIPLIKPRPLKTGDWIGIVAPAGTVEERSAFEQGIATLERLGLRVRFDERIFDTYRYLAGADMARAEELMRCFEAPDISAIIALRGGYGCSRLIRLLDEKRLRRHCKLFMGFSDLTTLLLYFRRRFGWITIHGPMVASAPMRQLEGAQQSHLWSVLADPRYLPELTFPNLECWYPGNVEGRVAGGCLSLLTASIGTTYEIKTEGKILFLEELGEAPYRIDRMLTQLQLAGKLESVAGILVGNFVDCDPERGDYTWADILQEKLCNLQVPVLAGFPSGHGADNWAIPMGIRIRLNADSKVVSFLESAVSEE